ncbi:MAG: PqqD family protein [Armatimonadota bacterium]
MEQGKAFLQFSQQKPRWSEQVEWQQRDEKIIVKIKRSDWLGVLLRWLTSRPVYRQIELDEIGGFVWSLCDGFHSVADIAQELQQRYQLSRREALSSLAEFLSQLRKRGLICWEEANKE